MSLFYKLSLNGFWLLHQIFSTISSVILDKRNPYVWSFYIPITFSITDLANRVYGNVVARKVVYFGFIIGILDFIISTNFSDIISIRIAIGSGIAFFIAQNLDIQIFNFLKSKMVYRPFNFFCYRLVIDTFFIFFNCFLWN